MRVVIVEGKGAVLRVSVLRPVETNGDFVAYLFESDALFPNYFGEGDLFVFILHCGIFVFLTIGCFCSVSFSSLCSTQETG